MNEHPIIMSSDMVKAILDGRKTQTRRIIKPQPKFDPPKVQEIWKCPYGKVGDRLWVREKHSLGGNGVFFPDSCDGTVHIAWTSARFMKKIYARIWLEIIGIRVERVQEISEEDAKAEGCDCSWLIHQAHDDAHNKRRAEIYQKYGTPVADTRTANEQSEFAYLWDSIHGKGAWEKNEWVWVIEFKRV